MDVLFGRDHVNHPHHRQQTLSDAPRYGLNLCSAGPRTCEEQNAEFNDAMAELVSDSHVSTNYVPLYLQP